MKARIKGVLRRPLNGEARRGGFGRATLLVVVAACCLAHGAHAQDGVQRFDIPADAADVVVNAIAQTSGTSILFPYDELRSVRAKGVYGRLSVHEALDVALEGSGLTVVDTSSGAIAIVAVPVEPPPVPLVDTRRPSRVLEDVEDAPLNRIVVTGTRIRRKGLMTPVPVTSVSSQEFDVLSPTTLISAIDQLPQFANNATPDYAVGSSGSTGQSLLNLRGIGSNRTLVLLDGRRVVSSTRRGTTDIGILPEALIDHVEIVTGGASASYGSDAVAGVVNFILDTDFEGVRGHVQAGATELGDYEHTEISLSAGFSLDERTHLLLAGDSYTNEGVANVSNRDWHQSWALMLNPADEGPTWIHAPNVVSASYTYGGLITSGPLAGTQFLENGQAAPFEDTNPNSRGFQQGGGGVDVALERTHIPANERQSGFAYLSRELSSDLTGYVQALYGRARVVYDKDPAYMASSWAGEVFIDNAYLPEDVRQRMIDAGVESFPFARYASKRDLGVGRFDSTNETTSLSLGLRGIVRGWRLDGYYQYGSNQKELQYIDIVRIDRIYQALDSVRDPDTDQIVCRSTLSFPDNGCVPTSFFGDGAVSEEAKAWILDDNAQIQELTQHVLDVAIDREPFDNWAGPVSIALGGSWRYDEYDQFAAPYTRAMSTPTDEEAGYRGLPEAYSDDYPLLERAVPPASHGKTNVWETFGEALIPLVSEVRFADEVNLLTALRYAYYEGSGGILAWKAGLDWTFNDELRLRGTVSRDVRAGTLAERYDRSYAGATASDPFLDDPPPVYGVVETENGNPNVDPEKADTFTVGVVYQPAWLPGLGASADYYDIDISGAISHLGAQQIIDLCYEGDDALCGLITRGPSGRITYVSNTFLNVDRARTRGVDIEVDYDTPITLFGGMESLGLRAIASLYQEASFTPFGRAPTDVAGVTGPSGGLPDYHLLLGANYARGPLSIDLTGRYIAEGDYSLRLVEGVDIDDDSVDGAFYANARVSYDFVTPRGSWQVFAGVTNAFDKDPPLSPGFGGGFFGTLQTNAIFDSVGRRYTAGVSWVY